MGEVWATGHLTATEDHPDARPKPVLHWAVAMPGTGNTNPREWAEDALVGLIEGL